MESVIEVVSVTFSLVVLFLVPCVLFVVYLIKRNGFYVSVNCWFCNSWTRVLYADRNSFCCSACLQYNGFDQDGGYNKVIEAQYDTSVNKPDKTSQKTALVTNGLCTYCNNNQRLKIYQLANFVPLNDNNYDVEVEHFEKQLEKAYKLCKKCDKVLKATIEKQHAWIFGNRLKSLQNKTLKNLGMDNIQQSTIKKMQELFFNCIKYMIILLCLFVIVKAMDIKVDYPRNKFKLPRVLIPYKFFLKDIYNLITNALINVIDNLNQQDLYLLKHFKYDHLLPITCMGFLLQTTFVLGNHTHIWWKINQLLGWILIVGTTQISVDPFYLAHIKLLQAFCAAIIIFSLLSSNKCRKVNTNSMKKKFGFKKIGKTFDNNDSSDLDEEISEGSNFSTSSRKPNSTKQFKHNVSGNCQPRPQSNLFQSKVQNTANLNTSFTTARSKTASVLNRSVKTSSDLSSSSDLNSSLDNLHLSNPTCTSPVFSVSSSNRPILSPSKLKNITQNSWTAGGFWKDDVSVFPVATEYTNLSRSSSQTSGFVSNNDPVNVHPFSSLPPSRETSVCGDFERTSILSEPPYHFQSVNSNNPAAYQKNVFTNHIPQSPRLSLSPNSSRLYYKADNNMFYPILNQDNMLFIQGSSHSNFESSFNNLSLKSFNMNSNGIKPPPLFCKPPVVSSLFKNLPGISAQTCSFKTPRC